MGAKHREPFQLSLNGSLWVDFQGSRVTPDDNLFLVREFDERLGFSELIAQHLTEPRRGKNTPRPVADMLRQSVYSRLAGYEDVNGAERVSQDSTFCLISSEKIWAAAGLGLRTARARVVMGLVVSGRLHKQSAAELGASETTIKRHRAWVMQQMGAESLTEMVRTVEKLGVPSTTSVPESPKNHSHPLPSSVMVTTRRPP